MRLKLVKQGTNFDFFSRWKIWLGISALMMVVGFASFAIQGLNFGIDFRGGTTVRTESTQPVDIGVYRDAMAVLELGDISITEVFDPTFDADQNVAMIRIQAQEGQEAVTPETIREVQHALGNATGSKLIADIALASGEITLLSDRVAQFGGIPTDDGLASTFVFPNGQTFEILSQISDAANGNGLVLERVAFSYDNISFPSVESVGPKVSGELIQTAAIAVILAIGAVLIYIWLRFEWQFALGAVAALVHDVILTIGVFSELQIKFDLAIIAALLTIVGYSLNDTVVVFDRVRENLRKYKKKPLNEVLNISINETLSRTVMTSVTTLLALISLYVLGGDVIRGFVFAMIWGVIVGTYSSVFVASTILLWLGVKRDWSKPDANAGNQFANVDA
ncbi:protein translocase subunit SecF [uncultured Tateyamaria sp.]|uniref:protein translocase subunit SecF n=1 Tax=uncultured Tateyamaria sp. TaxID=455651 RepID=UPI00263901D8|nr:protein translocase subunit SecF [uncultured Tateyamaria sp.]